MPHPTTTCAECHEPYEGADEDDVVCPACVEDDAELAGE